MQYRTQTASLKPNSSEVVTPLQRHCSPAEPSRGKKKKKGETGEFPQEPRNASLSPYKDGCAGFSNDRKYQTSSDNSAEQLACMCICEIENTYETTVFVETMYSTSLVQGFMKLNQRLLKVIKEPSFILNL